MRTLNESEEFKKYIVYLNTQDQLYEKGIDAKGRKLVSDFARFTNVYAYATIYGTEAYKGKIEKGQPIDRVTLKDTGKFYESFEVKLIGEQEFQIVADTLKETSNLIETWGKDIIGLTEENLGKLRVKARQILIDHIREQISNQLKSAA